MPNVPATPVSSTPASAPAPKGAASIDPKLQTSAGAAPKAATPEETFDVQIDGRVEKRTRKEIIEAYQLRQLSDKKRSEAERVLAEYKKLQDLGSKDPVALMKAMGYDFDDLATRHLSKKAEDAMKDPKELELERTRAENEQYKKWQQEQIKAQESAAKTAAVAKARENLHAEIIAAIEEKKELGLPVDEHLIIQIAQDMMVQDKAKKPLNAKEALPATYARTQKWLQGLASKMEGEALVTWLGQDVAKKIRKYDLAQLKAKRSTVQTAPGTAVKPAAQRQEVKPKAYKTWSDFKSKTLDNIK